MNVNSLPDELLASIFKYSNYESITGIRKLDSRIDRITKRYGIDKVPVINAHVFLSTGRSSFYMECRGIIWRLCGYMKHGARGFRLNKGQELEEVCAILAKIKIKSTFLLEIKRGFQLFDSWIDMFCKQKHSFRRFAFLNFDYEADYHCTRSSMRNFVKMCYKMREIEFCGSSSQYDMFNSEVLGSRNWDRLDLSLRGKLRTTGKVMDSQFLNNVVAKCNTFSMFRGLFFKIQDILDMIAGNLLDKKLDKVKHKWTFDNVSAGEFTLREMVRRMICLDGTQIEITPKGLNSNFAACKITIPSKPNVTINLLLNGESAEEITEIIDITKTRGN